MMGDRLHGDFENAAAELGVRREYVEINYEAENAPVLLENGDIERARRFRVNIRADPDFLLSCIKYGTVAVATVGLTVFALKDKLSISIMPIGRGSIVFEIVVPSLSDDRLETLIKDNVIQKTLNEVFRGAKKYVKEVLKERISGGEKELIKALSKIKVNSVNMCDEVTVKNALPVFWEEDKSGESLEKSAAEDVDDSDVPSTSKGPKKRKLEPIPSYGKLAKTEKIAIDEFMSFEVESKAESLMQLKKYGDSYTVLSDIPGPRGSLKIHLLTLECLLRKGSQKFLSELDKFFEEFMLPAASYADGDRLNKLGILRQNSKDFGKAIILFACAGKSYSDPYNISMSVFRVFGVSSKIKKAKKEDPTRKGVGKLPDEKNFGQWSEAIDICIKILQNLLEHLRDSRSRPYKYQHEVFALNWIAACCNHFMRYEKAASYSREGIDIMEHSSKCGKCLDTMQTYGDLYHNLGFATSVIGNKREAKNLLKKALDAKHDTKYKSPKEKERSIKFTADFMKNLSS